MSSLEGLPPANNDQQFMNTWATNIFSNNYDVSNSMPVSQASIQWVETANLLADFDDQPEGDYYGYSPSSQSHENDEDLRQSQNNAEIPRTWPLQYEPRIAYENSMMSKNYKPSIYTINPIMETPRSTSRQVSGFSYDAAQESSQDFARLTISRSVHDAVDAATVSFEKPPGCLMPSRESSNDSENCSRDMTVADIEDHGVEEPYAKLIYRALMSAPNHSMVLQEIYQWFRDNTVKGSSDTKGWMNSIRHNLSMNAVRVSPAFLGLCSHFTGFQEDRAQSFR